jgi:hypothetical protein
MNKIKIVFFMLLFFFVVGCEKKPVRDLIFPNLNEATSWDEEWILYGGVDGVFGEDIRTKNDDPIKVLTDYWGNEVHSNELAFYDTSQYHSGRTSIRMQWNGDKSKSFETQENVNYIGFYFESNGASVNISNGGYNYLKFWVKGELTDGVSLKVTSDTCGGETNALFIYVLNTFWKEYSMGVTNNSNIKNMALFALTSQMESNGGEVYIDDIRYVK